MNNIFDYATSELSQDAFLCYLFNFASDEHKNEDLHLNRCAVEMLRKIISSKYSNEVNNENIRVTELIKQHNNIDVYIQVNNKYHIILEDKTYTSQHSEQIKRYKNLLKGIGKENIITVYYKIIGQAHQEDVNIHITRKDMLDCMTPYIDKTENTIFKNYYDFLMTIEKSVQEFKVLPIKKWEGPQYRGFFKHLTNRENPILNFKERDFGWGYVANPSGGFHGLWWYFTDQDNLQATGLKDVGVTDMYLQIEDDAIVMKITSEKPINAIKWHIYNYFTQTHTIPGFTKKRFRNGNVMSIGYITYDENDYQEKIKVMENALDEIRNGRYQLTL